MSSNVIEVNEYEAEAITIISELLSGRGSFHLERRSENYLTLVVGEYDFCRIKATERTCWMSIDMWCCSDEIRSDKRLDSVKNKNQRHWKIQLLGIYDIRNYADILAASFEGSMVRNAAYNPNQVDELQHTISSGIDKLHYKIIEPSNSRLQKGKSLLEFVDDYTVIDLETTGFSPSDDEIIEFAGIKVKSGVVVDTYQTLIKPSMEVDDYISSLTGITNDMLSDAPALIDVLPQILSFVGDDIIVGHNVSFDINFLYDNCNKLLSYAFRNDYFDVMRISRILLPNIKHHRLKDVAKELEIPITSSHRSMADCETTLKCYQELQWRHGESIVATFPILKNKDKFNAKNITAETDSFDESNPLFGKNVVFTGKLDRYTREQAAQMVVNLGGICENTVTKNTDFLILGDTDYSKNIKDGKSSKQKKAESYILKGCDISVIPESVFYDMITED